MARDRDVIKSSSVCRTITDWYKPGIFRYSGAGRTLLLANSDAVETNPD